jgi:hypothetical protein
MYNSNRYNARDRKLISIEERREKFRRHVFHQTYHYPTKWFQLSDCFIRGTRVKTGLHSAGRWPSNELNSSSGLWLSDQTSSSGRQLIGLR